MALNRFIDKLVGGEEETEVTPEEEFYSVSREEFQSKNGTGKSKMMLLEPRAFSESQQIADYLKSRISVVVNLKRVTPDQAKRIVDFLSGTIYAIGGKMQKLGGGIFLCAPNTVNIEGVISDENQNAKASAKSKKTSTNEEEDDFF